MLNGACRCWDTVNYSQAVCILHDTARHQSLSGDTQKAAILGMALMLKKILETESASGVSRL